VIDEEMLIFDPKEEEEPFFYQGIRQNHRDIRKKQNKDLEFYFDQVFDCDSSNEAVFKGTTENLVKFLLDGYNCSGAYNSVSFVFVLDDIIHSSDVTAGHQRLYL
jgi:kinesin family protein 18/19